MKLLIFIFYFFHLWKCQETHQQKTIVNTVCILLAGAWLLKLRGTSEWKYSELYVTQHVLQLRSGTSNCISAANDTVPIYFFITGYSVFFISKVLSERDLTYTLYSNQHKRTPTFVELQVSTAVRCAIQLYTESKISPSTIGNCSYPDSSYILSQRSILCEASLGLDSGLSLSQTYHITNVESSALCHKS